MHHADTGATSGNEIVSWEYIITTADVLDETGLLSRAEVGYISFLLASLHDGMDGIPNKNGF